MAAPAPPPAPLVAPALAPHPTTVAYPSYTPLYFGSGPNLPINCGARDQRMPPVQPCTSTFVGFMNARHFVPGVPLGGPFGPYAQHPCGGVNCAPHTLCYHCNRILENEMWYKLAAARIMREPPTPANETNHWRGFLTRMCQLCERREQYLIFARWNWAVVPPLAPAPAQRALMYDYPWNTCTCKNRLDDGVLCRPERQDHWNTLRDQLVQRRNDAKNWLFRIAIGTPPLRPLHLRTAKRRRRERRIALTHQHCLRACRCGDEVTDQAPVVWQCMACEGIIEANRANGLTFAQVGMRQPTPDERTNSATPWRPLRFHRPVSATLH